MQFVARPDFNCYFNQKSETFYSCVRLASGFLRKYWACALASGFMSTWSELMERSSRFGGNRVDYKTLNSISTLDLEPFLKGRRKYDLKFIWWRGLLAGEERRMCVFLVNKFVIWSLLRLFRSPQIFETAVQSLKKRQKRLYLSGQLQCRKRSKWVVLRVLQDIRKPKWR